MERAISLAEHVDEIRLAAASPPAGFLRRRGWRIWEIAQGHRITPGALQLTDDALIVSAETVFDDRLEIPWNSIRKVVVDDGTRWGYVSGVCRFPVYDLRADGSGSGVLIGPLWSQASSLMPAGCPIAALDPVPGQAPNVALIFEQLHSAPMADQQKNGGPREADSIVALLLRAEDPVAAREALAARHQVVGDIDHDDLEFLSRAAGSRPANRAARNGASASAT